MKEAVSLVSSLLLFGKAGVMTFGAFRFRAPVVFVHFDHIQDHAQWLTLLFQVNCKCNKCLVIGGGPCVCCETQFAIIFLIICGKPFSTQSLLTVFTYL
jgi:hypothetical protein